MAGNTFGHIFRVTTWGESHGPGVGAVIDCCPPRLPLAPADIDAELARRRPGVQAHATARREPDKVEILSGVFEGLTTGTPISLIIYNKDIRSQDYEELKDVFRPGHGDITYQAKYGIRDHQGGGRASARETAARVAAGAVAQKVLDRVGIQVMAYTVELGGIPVAFKDVAFIWDNPFACADSDAVRTGPEIAELDDFRLAYECARQSLQFGSPPLGQETCRVTDYEDLGLLRIISMAESPTSLERFCLDAIGPLLAYDQENDTHLASTLRTYLEQNQNSARTAKLLFIHYNTLRYRLDRARDILGDFLENPRQRLEIAGAASLPADQAHLCHVGVRSGVPAQPQLRST